MVQQIITVISTALPLIAGIITFILKFIKSEKGKRALQQTLKIVETLQPLVRQAEEFSHYTGVEKREFVLTKANQFAIDNKLPFDREKIAEAIDMLVETTKKVNARETRAALPVEVAGA